MPTIVVCDIFSVVAQQNCKRVAVHNPRDTVRLWRFAFLFVLTLVAQSLANAHLFIAQVLVASIA